MILWFYNSTLHPLSWRGESPWVQNLTLMSSQHPCEVDRYHDIFLRRGNWGKRGELTCVRLHSKSGSRIQVMPTDVSTVTRCLTSHPTSSPGLNEKHPRTTDKIHLVQHQSFCRLLLLQKWHKQVLQNTSHRTWIPKYTRQRPLLSASTSPNIWAPKFLQGLQLQPFSCLVSTPKFQS